MSSGIDRFFLILTSLELFLRFSGGRGPAGAGDRFRHTRGGSPPRSSTETIEQRGSRRRIAGHLSLLYSREGLKLAARKGLRKG